MTEEERPEAKEQEACFAVPQSVRSSRRFPA